jgi:hypothetical protein
MGVPVVPADGTTAAADLAAVCGFLRCYSGELKDVFDAQAAGIALAAGGADGASRAAEVVARIRARLELVLTDPAIFDDGRCGCGVGGATGRLDAALAALADGPVAVGGGSMRVAATLQARQQQALLAACEAFVGVVVTALEQGAAGGLGEAFMQRVAALDARAAGACVIAQAVEYMQAPRGAPGGGGGGEAGPEEAALQVERFADVLKRIRTELRSTLTAAAVSARDEVAALLSEPRFHAAFAIVRDESTAVAAPGAAGALRAARVEAAAPGDVRGLAWRLYIIFTKAVSAALDGAVDRAVSGGGRGGATTATTTAAAAGPQLAEACAAQRTKVLRHAARLCDLYKTLAVDAATN